MKKIISLLFVLLLTFSFVSCKDTVKSPEDLSSNPQQTDFEPPNNQSADETDFEAPNNQSTDETDFELPNNQSADETDFELPNNRPSDESDDSEEKIGIFNKSATIEETVLVDEGDVKIMATGLNYTNYSVKLELTIENNSDKDLSFISGSIGYSCNSINGYMISDGYLNCDVSAGKKANDSISFRYDGLMLYGISEIADMEIGFDISDDDYNHIYTGVRQIKTSAFGSYDYATNHYQSAITSRTAMNTYGYDIRHFSEEVLYDDSGVKLVSSSIIVNRDGDTMLLLELENTTDNIVYIATSDIVLNGLAVSSYTWSSDAINPGKYRVVDVDLSSVLDAEYWSVFGINEIGSVELSLAQRNADGDDITGAVPVKVVVPGAKAEYDSTGKEIYNNGGLRIVAKTILEDSSKYRADMYILLLAENNSGKTLVIDDAYNSLSVNDFMTDYSYYSKEIKNGESAVLEIKLWESSLKNNKITSISDVKEVEIGFEIEEGYNTFDNPTIKISFD